MSRGAAPFELPAELAIDTDVARRVIGEFIRGQLRQAGLRAGGAGAVGRHRFGARGVPRRRGDRRRAAAVRADAVPDLVAGVAGRCRGRSSPRSAARASWSRSAPMVDGYFGTDGGDRRAGADGPEAIAAPARQLHGPDADGRPVRPLGDLGRAGRRDRQQDRVAHRLHDPVRRHAPAPSTRSATCTRARSASWRRRSACPTRSSARRRRPTCGPARPTRPRRGFSYPELDRLLFWLDRQAPLARRARRDGLRRRRWSSGSTGWSPAAEFKRQVPPIAKLGPRTAGIDYLYPRRRPGSARERDPAVRRRRRTATGAAGGHAVSSSRRRSGTSATSRSGRSRCSATVPADRGRGHPPDAPAAGPLRDRRRAWSATTPGTQPVARAELLDAPARRRRPGARHRRRHARRQRPGRRARARPGRPRAGSVVPIPGRIGGAGGRRGIGRRRAALDLRGLPAADRAASGANGSARIAADERGTRRLRGAGPGRGDARRPRRGLRRRAAGGGLPGADQAPRGDRPRLARRRSPSGRAAAALIPLRGEFALVVGERRGRAPRGPRGPRRQRRPAGPHPMRRTRPPLAPMWNGWLGTASPAARPPAGLPPRPASPGDGCTAPRSTADRFVTPTGSARPGGRP